MCVRLNRFVDGKIKRLMIFCPPQVGKSEIISRKLPAFIFGKNPDSRIIATSYAPMLASRMNRDVQKLIDSAAYKEIFPGTALFGRNVATEAHGNYLRNSEIFELVNHYGSYRCAGVGQGITGMSADFILVDDPVKDRALVNSAVWRDRLWDWYTDALQTRKHNGTGILITCTRWHDDDLVARLIKKMETDPEADQWEILSLPAIMDDIEAKHPDDPRKLGEPLWPEQQDLKSLQVTKNTAGEYTWEAMYQQRPAPRGGGHYFKSSQLSTSPGEGFISIMPADIIKWVRGWDLAATPEDERGNAAFTAGVLMGKRKNGRYIVADVKNKQLSANDVRTLMKQTAQLDSDKYGSGVAIRFPQDPGQAGKAQAGDIVKMLAGSDVKSVVESGDKETRATPFAAQWQAGNVDILIADWNEVYISQLESFPSGKFKDMVDASATAFNDIEANKTITASGKRGMW